MGREKNRHTIDIVFALILFLVFTASALLTLMIGAGVYRQTAAAIERRYEERTCLSYIAAKVRHFDTFGAIYVEAFGDGDALVLCETVRGVEYSTYLYLYEGSVMELFTEKGLGLSPKDGFEILPAEELTFRLEGRLLSASYRGKNGSSSQIMLCLRTGGKGEGAA